MPDLSQVLAELNEAPAPDLVIEFPELEGTEAEEIRWRLDGETMNRANDQGFQPSDVFSCYTTVAQAVLVESEGSDDEIVDAAMDAFDAIAKLVWVGALRYDKELKLEQVRGLIRYDSVEAVPVMEIIDQFSPGYKARMEALANMSEEELQDFLDDLDDEDVDTEKSSPRS